MPVARTAHLFGPGAVGCAWLTMMASEGISLIGITDRSGTVWCDDGLDIGEVIAHKQRGEPLSRWRGPGLVRPGDDEPHPGALLIAETTPSEEKRGERDAERIRSWIARGHRVALASKHAVAADPELLLSERLGVNAVLGGTGARLQAALPDLRRSWTQCAIAGSLSTSLVVSILERGGSIAQGLAEAEAMGVLEPDPERDLSGIDAVIKLRIVAGALLGRPIDPEEIAAQHLREIDPDTLRARARQGRTTRLVGRASREGALTQRYEVLDRDDALARGPAELVYAYYSDDGSARVFTGQGLGAEGTAAAMHVDVVRLLREE